MKGFIALVFVALLGLSAFNWWQVQELKQEVARLQVKVQEQAEAKPTDQVLAEATRAIANARQALAGTDWDRARGALESARASLQSAARNAGDKAAPTVKWLEDQAADLSKQVQDRIKR